MMRYKHYRDRKNGIEFTTAMEKGTALGIAIAHPGEAFSRELGRKIADRRARDAQARLGEGHFGGPVIVTAAHPRDVGLFAAAMIVSALVAAAKPYCCVVPESDACAADVRTIIGLYHARRGRPRQERPKYKLGLFLDDDGLRIDEPNELLPNADVVVSVELAKDYPWRRFESAVNREEMRRDIWAALGSRPDVRVFLRVLCSDDKGLVSVRPLRQQDPTAQAANAGS